MLDATGPRENDAAVALAEDAAIVRAVVFVMAVIDSLTKYVGDGRQPLECGLSLRRGLL